MRRSTIKLNISRWSVRSEDDNSIDLRPPRCWRRGCLQLAAVAAGGGGLSFVFTDLDLVLALAGGLGLLTVGAALAAVGWLTGLRIQRDLDARTASIRAGGPSGVRRRQVPLGSSRVVVSCRHDWSLETVVDALRSTPRYRGVRWALLVFGPTPMRLTLTPPMHSAELPDEARDLVRRIVRLLSLERVPPQEAVLFRTDAPEVVAGVDEDEYLQSLQAGYEEHEAPAAGSPSSTRSGSPLGD
jgi:hypothetical protein